MLFFYQSTYPLFLFRKACFLGTFVPIAVFGGHWISFVLLSHPLIAFIRNKECRYAFIEQMDEKESS